MEKNYSISDILSAIEEINDKKIENKKKISKNQLYKNDYSEVPKHTMKLIEEAEKIK